MQGQNFKDYLDHLRRSLPEAPIPHFMVSGNSNIPVNRLAQTATFLQKKSGLGTVPLALSASFVTHDFRRSLRSGKKKTDFETTVVGL
jgi:hypothetical protein